MSLLQLYINIKIYEKFILFLSVNGFIYTESRFKE